MDIIAHARRLASSADMYEMAECPDTYASCSDPACIHTMLLAAAAAQS